MTSTPPVGEPEKQWQQPAFAPEAEVSAAPVEGTVVPAGTDYPMAPRTPPSVVEAITGTISGLVWPVMIVLAIMGAVGWWPAMLVALVSSIVLGNLTGFLKARRHALAARPAAPRDRDLR